MTYVVKTPEGALFVNNVIEELPIKAPLIATGITPLGLWLFMLKVAAPGVFLSM